MSTLDDELIDALRKGWASRSTLAQLINLIKSKYPQSDSAFVFVLYLRHVFHLPLYEARQIEGSTLIGGTAYSEKETEEKLIPSIRSYFEVA